MSNCSTNKIFSLYKQSREVSVNTSDDHSLCTDTNMITWSKTSSISHKNMCIDSSVCYIVYKCRKTNFSINNLNFLSTIELCKLRCINTTQYNRFAISHIMWNCGNTNNVSLIKSKCSASECIDAYFNRTYLFT